jgi:hypothetical protein
MIRIDTAFEPKTQSIHDFYQQPGIGYYIPTYQREYTWDSDNIEQLLQDLSKGIENCLNDEDEIRFLGTIIAVQEDNPTLNIEPLDPKGLPSRIDKIIDGQQRLSTICILSTLLHKELIKIESEIKDSEPLKGTISECIRYWNDKLIEVFSLDLKRGTPRRKPKIIRGNKDTWTEDRNIADCYTSPISKYLSEYIEYVFNNGNEPIPNKKNNVGSNIIEIKKWLEKTVINAHKNDNNEFLPAWDIISSSFVQKYLWSYDRPELKDIILKKEINNKKSIEYTVCSLTQIFSVCHYLLERCCFTIIKPTKDDWAFDLFQSLNATGTPLTAIETFLPLVVNTTTKEENSYKNSQVKKYFENIENLFSELKTANQKNKRTNEFLTSLALTTTGEQISSHFSHQRKWLNKIYERDSKEYVDKVRLIKFFGNYASFYKNIWSNYKGENNILIRSIDTNKDANLASLLIVFLKNSNHKMAITILGRFYCDILNGKLNSSSNFIEATKTITCFYILWRSAKSNSGLDSVYREFIRAKKQNWLNKETISILDLKEFLNKKLVENDISTKEEWIKKSKTNCKYNNSSAICKMNLLIAFDDTIIDKTSLGLMKKGNPGSSPYLNLEKFISEDLKTIEHIAPRKSNNKWDDDLYKENELYESIGNLTLLPVKINSSASNKPWEEKLIYFKHLSEKDPERLKELENRAKTDGIILEIETVNLLRNSNFNEHITPLVQFGASQKWDSKVVEKRTKRILDLVWDKINPWLN